MFHTTARLELKITMYHSMTALIGILLMNSSAPLLGQPSVTSVSPSSGSGTFAIFSMELSHPSGATSLDIVNMLINDALTGVNACYIAYKISTNTVFLVNDAGQSGGPFAGAFTLSGTGTEAATNSQCTIFAAGTSAVFNGNTPTLGAQISFTSAFAGPKVLYVAAYDQGETLAGRGLVFGAFRRYR